MKRIFLSTLALLIVASSLFAQSLNLPAASPFERIEQKFSLSKIIIEYSRPGVKDRIIFGDLVPFGHVWRTGANSCTKIYFGEDVKVEGHDLAKGIYALFTIPEKDSWTIIFSSDTSLWGAFDYKPETDVLRVNVKPQVLPLPLETFTITINNIRNESCDVQLMWEKTMASFHIATDIDSKVMVQIDEAMKGEKPPYYQAANYYFENGKDINLAYQWVQKAVQMDSTKYYKWNLKARIEQKMGKVSEAKASVMKALDIARKEDNFEATQLNERLLQELNEAPK